MGRVIKEIDAAIKSLDIDPSSFVRLNREQNENLYQRLLEKFVASGNRRWWWEDFKLPKYDFEEHPNRIEQLRSILVEIKEKVWFMPEDDEYDFYPIYESEPAVIPDILSECFFFEYYIISKQENWLICENHHNHLIGINSIE